MELSDCDPNVRADGVLEFAYPGGRNSCGEISPWSAGFETRTIRNGFRLPSYFWALEMFSDEIRTSLPNSAVDFLASIPADVRRNVGAYRFGQCFMLRYAAAYSEAQDLLHSNPILYWLLACAAYDGNIDQDHFPGLCQRKQVKILGKLIPGAAKATLRLLSKITVEFGSIHEARIIRHVLARQSLVKAVAHLSNVPFRLLEVLGRHGRLVTPSLAALILRELQSESRDPAELGRNLDEIVADLGSMASVLDIDSPHRAIARCKTAAELTALHDRWVERQNRKFVPIPADGPLYCREDTSDRAPLIFPPPPYPDSADIQAIRTFDELILEGQEQRHCVASYALDVAAGKVYIYRVLRPSRATLELRETDDGWKVGQIKLFRNGEPELPTRMCVQDWLRQVSQNDLPERIVI